VFGSGFCISYVQQDPTAPGGRVVWQRKVAQARQCMHALLISL